MKTFIEVLNALESLAKESSTIEKVNLLKRFGVHELFQRVLKAALEDHRNYHMTRLPSYPVHGHAIVERPTRIFKQLEYLQESTGATFLDKETLAMLSSANSASLEVVSRIVKKDLRCGVSAKTANKAIPRLINTWPYMRCLSFNTKNMKRIKYPAQIEEKADGAHIDIVLKDKKVRFVSRKGRNMNFHKKLDFFFTSLDTLDDLVFIGEAEVLDHNGNIYNRKTGNGIILKAIKNTITEEEAARVVITLWDVVPYHDFMNGLCLIPHDVRFAKLKELFPGKSVFPKIIPHKTVHDEAEAIKAFEELRQNGCEGAIIKNRNGVFNNTTSPNQVKMKAEFDAEFEVIDWVYGKPGTKYENNLGSIQVMSSDGKVKSWVGSGFSHKERIGGLKDEIVGKTITVRFESLISKKGTENISLYLPRFIEIRHDKDTADDLPYLLDLTGGPTGNNDKII